MRPRRTVPMQGDTLLTDGPDVVRATTRDISQIGRYSAVHGLPDNVLATGCTDAAGAAAAARNSLVARAVTTRAGTAVCESHPGEDHPGVCAHRRHSAFWKP